MNKNIIKNIQKQIIQLLPANQQNRPDILLADTCSEMARLVAGWIKVLDGTSHILIMKGTDICGTQKAHDIITVTTAMGQIYIIDPTVWQFFPRIKSILFFVSGDISIIRDKINARYGGQWSVSEEFIEMTKNEEKKYLKVISQNVNENLRQFETKMA